MTELIEGQAGRPLALYIIIAALIAATTIFTLYWMLPYYTTTEVEHMRQHELRIPHFMAASSASSEKPTQEQNNEAWVDIGKVFGN